MFFVPEPLPDVICHYIFECLWIGITSLSYRDGMTMTWENGRQLSTLKTGENEVSYKYDSNVLRTQKEDDNGTTYNYYDSNKNLIGLTKGYKTLYFYYDSEGLPTINIFIRT